MTDKPIMIDGVDVSGCSYAILPKSQCPQKAMLYAKEVSCIACKENNTKLNFCKNNHNCNYKQLQRKTAECEELQAKYKWYDHYKNSALSNKELCDKKSDEIKLLHYKLQIATGVLKEIYDQADEIFSDGFRASLFCKQVRSLSLQALEQLGSEE